MKAYTVKLKEEYNFLQGGELACLLMEKPFPEEREWKRPAVVVVPGGGYWQVSKREGEPISSAFMSLGYQTFILHYLCAPQNVRYPEQLLELASAVDYIRKHATELNVNQREVFIVGFSAGGHLAANLSVAYSRIEELAGVALDCKPKAVGLAYPVISYYYGHTGSYEYLLQGYPEQEKQRLLKETNLDELVSAETSPTFIWSTAQDTCVPPENTIRYTLALAKAGVPYESHIYPLGQHGLSTASAEVCPFALGIPKVAGWIKDCSDFFRMYTEEKV
jgi:acetyl esterase/lipase